MLYPHFAAPVAGAVCVGVIFVFVYYYYCIDPRAFPVLVVSTAVSEASRVDCGSISTRTKVRTTATTTKLDE